MRLIDADALRETWLCLPGHDFDPSSFVYSIDNAPTVEPASPWRRAKEPPKKTGKYAVCWTYQEKIYWDWLFFIDGNWVLQAGLPLPDYWMPIEPPKEDV